MDFHKRYELEKTIIDGLEKLDLIIGNYYVFIHDVENAKVRIHHIWEKKWIDGRWCGLLNQPEVCKIVENTGDNTLSLKVAENDEARPICINVCKEIAKKRGMTFDIEYI